MQKPPQSGLLLVVQGPLDTLVIFFVGFLQASTPVDVVVIVMNKNDWHSFMSLQSS